MILVQDEEKKILSKEKRIDEYKSAKSMGRVLRA